MTPSERFTPCDLHDPIRTVHAITSYILAAPIKAIHTMQPTRPHQNNARRSSSVTPSERFKPCNLHDPIRTVHTMQLDDLPCRHNHLTTKHASLHSWQLMSCHFFLRQCRLQRPRCLTSMQTSRKTNCKLPIYPQNVQIQLGQFTRSTTSCNAFGGLFSNELFQHLQVPLSSSFTLRQF